MKKWVRWVLIVGLSIGIATACVYEVSTYIGRGWLRDEAFYDGRPTSYWREVIVVDYDEPQPTLYQRAIKATLGIDTRTTSFALATDENAKPVLQQLALDEDMRVSAFACYFRDWKAEGSDQQREFEGRVAWQFWWIKLDFNRYKTEYSSDR